MITSATKYGCSYHGARSPNGLATLTEVRYFRENEHPMEVTLAVLADYANLSSDNKLNILGIFNQINPPMLPFRLPQMYLVCAIDAEPTEVEREFQFEILLWDSDGNQVLGIEQPIRFAAPDRPGARASHNVIMGFSNVPFERADDYAFFVRIGGEQRRRIALRVNEPRAVEA